MAAERKMYHLEYAFYRKRQLQHHAETTTSDPRGDVNFFLSESRMVPLYMWTVTKSFKEDKGVQLECSNYQDSRLIVILNEMKPVSPISIFDLTVEGRR
jgi:hypothetical protein